MYSIENVLRSGILVIIITALYAIDPILWQTILQETTMCGWYDVMNDPDIMTKALIYNIGIVVWRLIY